MSLRKSKPALVALGAASLLAVAAGAATAAGAPPLTGTVWQLATLRGKAPLAGAAVSLKLTRAGKLSGSSGCNTYSGTYTAGRGSIRVAPTLVSTRMACAPAVMTQETRYLDALVAARAYSIGHGKLTLWNAPGKALASFTVESQALGGTSWNVTAYHDGTGLSSVLAGTSLTAAFGKDGTVSGFSGCNHYSATFTVKGQRLSLGPIAATEMACLEPAGAMAQEAAFMSALGSTRTYRIESSRLELRDAKGAVVLSLAPA